MSTGEAEIHKSMIDGKERKGIEPHGKFESNPDDNPATFDESSLDKKSSNTGGSSTDASTASRQGSTTTGDTDRKPAGGTETGGVAKPQSGSEIQQGQNTNPMSNSNEPNQGFGGAGAQPSVDADVSDADKNEKGNQGAKSSTEQPNEEGESEQSKSKTESGGEPKPLGSDSKGGESGGAQTGPGGMKLPESHGSKEGTGEKWEKSTGVQAEGGDFDAVRPGAGKEADRLMEQAGITRTDQKPKIDEDDAPKRYGVDHSGFGGHGSHQNKPRTSSKPDITDDADASATDPKHDPTQAPAHTDKTIPGSDPGKKSLLEKAKEKLHVGHDNQ